MTKQSLFSLEFELFQSVDLCFGLDQALPNVG